MYIMKYIAEGTDEAGNPLDIYFEDILGSKDENSKMVENIVKSLEGMGYKINKVRFLGIGIRV